MQSSKEEDENGEKKKKKKQGLKEKIKEKISGEKEETTENKDSSIAVENCDEKATHHPEEKKGFLEVISDQ